MTWNEDAETPGEPGDIDDQFAALQAMLDARRRRADAARFCCRKPIPCRGCPRMWAAELEPETTS